MDIGPGQMNRKDYIPLTRGYFEMMIVCAQMFRKEGCWRAVKGDGEQEVLTDLDDEFGPLVVPLRVDPWEQKWVPLSLSKLEASSALSIKRHMEEVTNGWLVGRVLMTDVLIIWLVDEHGLIWFAVEELVPDGQHKGLPKFQRFPLTERLPKLGHPALLGHPPLAGFRAARIAGEIQFNVVNGEWSINNGSGRYGLDKSRNARHLSNVVRIFRDFGILLRPYFYPPKSM